MVDIGYGDHASRIGVLVVTGDWQVLIEIREISSGRFHLPVSFVPGGWRLGLKYENSDRALRYSESYHGLVGTLNLSEVIWATYTFYRAKRSGDSGIAKGSCPSIRLSVTLRYHDHIGWNSDNIQSSQQNIEIAISTEVHTGETHAYITALWGVRELLWTCGEPHKE